ncbi:MAG: outer membrane beta-barrel protein [Gammaproteobacteria bacterium]|nr:outer membrane beta-barrel protein [Gammaproteobacteria bacterium]
MKKLLLTLALLAATTSVSQADRGDQYLLPKFGFMSVQLNNADPLYSIGVLYGYGITPEITVEAELNAGVTGGDSNLGGYEIWTLAGYGVYRYPVTVTGYIKAKLGLLHEAVSLDGNSASDQGAAGGIGYGFRYGQTIYEFEATVIDEDIIFYSLGVNYPF